MNNIYINNYTPSLKLSYLILYLNAFNPNVKKFQTKYGFK